MAEYKSSYTGEQIDAGIAKANTALQEHQDLSGKQDKLVSGESIKTINNVSILGRGNIEIQGGSGGLNSVAHDNTLTGAGTNASPLSVVGGGSGNSDIVKDRALYENIRQISKLSTFPLYTIKGNIGILGDSIIAGAGGQKVAPLLSVAQGYTITDISYSGDRISNQLTKWNALSSTVKSNMNYVFVQLGINDVAQVNNTETIKASYATLINKIKEDTEDAVIIICTMTPCKQRWKDLYGSNWEFHEIVWEEVNETIKNNIYSASKVCYLHTEAMAYDENNLRPEYDSGDHLHENAAGAKVIAYCWYATAVDNSPISPSTKTVSSIAVTTPPTKTAYTTDDYFDPTGMVVTATYSDGSTAVVNNYTYSPTTKLTVATTAITISYAEKTTTTPITVTESTKVLESIEATYTQGQTRVYPDTSLDRLKSNLVVVATYDDTSTETLQDGDYTLSGTLEVGTSTITVTYEGKTDTFDVTVSQPRNGKWVLATANNLTHEQYIALGANAQSRIGSPYNIYCTQTSWFEGKTVTKVSIRGLKNANVTLYASPISESPTSTNNIEVGNFSVTANAGTTDYNVINPQTIPEGYTLAMHYDAADCMNTVSANSVTTKLDTKTMSTGGATSYTASVQLGGPDFYVED